MNLFEQSGYARISEMVFNGFVFDDDGTWILLQDKVKKDRAFHDAIFNGLVFCDKRWVTMGEAKLLMKNAVRSVNISDTNQPEMSDGLPFPPETVLLISEEN